MAACCSCSQRALLTLNDGSQVNGRIIKGTSTEVLVEERGDSVVRIPRERVHDVDHPGDAALVVGSVLSMSALAVATYFASTCEDRGDMVGRNCGTTSFILMSPVIVSGASIALWGGVVHAGSTRRLGRPVAARQENLGTQRLSSGD